MVPSGLDKEKSLTMQRISVERTRPTPTKKCSSKDISRERIKFEIDEAYMQKAQDINQRDTDK